MYYAYGQRAINCNCLRSRGNRSWKLTIGVPTYGFMGDTRKGRYIYSDWLGLLGGSILVLSDLLDVAGVPLDGNFKWLKKRLIEI